MASTAFLIAAIVVVICLVLGLRLLIWRVVGAAAGPGSPARVGAPAEVVVRVDRQPFASAQTKWIVSAAVCDLVVLGALVTFVIAHHGVVQFDQAADDFFRPYRAPWLIKAAEWVTALGAGPSLAAILATATVLLWSGGRTRCVPPLWIAFLGAQATTWTAKYVIHRPRPVFLPGITEWNPSFPSGHATATTALFGMVGMIAAASVPGLRARFEVEFWTIVVVALVCFSRIFLGVHFVTDVLAGIMVGALWLLVGYAVGGRRRRRDGG